MASRTMGEIMNGLQKNPDENVRMLAKELSNAIGQMTMKMKEEIISGMYAECEHVEGKDEEYLSLSTAQTIVRTAGEGI